MLVPLLSFTVAVGPQGLSGSFTEHLDLCSWWLDPRGMKAAAAAAVTG
jgi:hypothetical protein